MATLILFNKPYGVLSQFTDNEGRATLAEFIDIQGVYPAGRLDRDSEGLLLLTDDGALQHKISHPQNKMSKTYWALTEGDAIDADLTPLREGVQLKDGTCQPAKVQFIEPPHMLWPRHPPVRVRQHIVDSWLSVTISEGRNRQVRRMTAAIGHPTLRLIRYRVGSWTLDGIAPGEFKVLNI